MKKKKIDIDDLEEGKTYEVQLMRMKYKGRDILRKEDVLLFRALYLDKDIDIYPEEIYKILEIE